jgi:excinuclease ABC subunit B
MYADKITNAMSVSIDETTRRREKQRLYNEAHGITPRTIVKAIKSMDPSMGQTDYVPVPHVSRADAKDAAEQVEMLRSEMLLAAESLDFERAAQLRDQIRRLEGGADSTAKSASSPRKRGSMSASSSSAPPAKRARSKRR